ncbi:hypothetical protein MTR_0795s0030 [Medicago truncatula]|uniref:Uncharacterized protein n=1 Tax=Medicago truncatula TaxID=3880 RepID=A0A072TE99_MEDTR|nr:hypothetical protein MTR_0795s0030 [Medicago truncatula]
MRLKVLKHCIPHPFQTLNLNTININRDNHVQPSPRGHHPVVKFRIGITLLYPSNSEFLPLYTRM